MPEKSKVYRKPLQIIDYDMMQDPDDENKTTEVKENEELSQEGLIGEQQFQD